MKLFIDPADDEGAVRDEPGVAEGADERVGRRAELLPVRRIPNVKPRVITHFEPWMALSFSEGSIGGDIETVNLGQLEAFYGKTPAPTPTPRTSIRRCPATTSRRGSNGIAIAPSNTDGAARAAADQSAHVVLLPRRSADDERRRAERLRRADLGPVLHLPGLQRPAGWMHTSSGVDNIDEYLETVTKKGDGYFYKYGTEERPVVDAARSPCRTRRRRGMAQKEFTVYRTHHGPIVREAERQVGRVRADAGAAQGADAVVLAHQGDELQDVPADDGAAHQLVEQHDLRRRRRQHRLLPLELHPEARSEVRLDASRWTAAIRRPSGRALLSIDETPNLLNPASGWLYNTNNWPWSAAGPSSPKQADFPAYVDNGSENRARHPRDPRAREQEGLHARRR